MIREQISARLTEAITSLIADGKLPAAHYGVPEVNETKDPAHGDYASNIAMTASKAAGMNPRAFAEILVSVLRETPDFDAVEIAGPGFLNFRLKSTAISKWVDSIRVAGIDFCRLKPAKSESINVEFVSVNPNGPITIGSGRGAAFGSALCNVLEFAGHKVHREYYINDGVNSEQMRLFAESVRAFAQGLPFPENGYKGDYVEETAKQVVADLGGPESAGQASLDTIRDMAEKAMIEAQRTGLIAFGVEFDTWFSEQSLHDSGEVEACIAELESSGVADHDPHRIKLKLAKGGVVEEVIRETQVKDDEDDATGDSPTLWLRSTKFGDDMDRVLRRKDGRLTYIASDVAYHKDKLTDGTGTRGTGPVDRMLTVLGPDHHGYIARLQAVVAAYLKAESSSVPESKGELNDIEAGIYADPVDRDACHAALANAKAKLEVVIFQLVRFVKDGQPAPMRKRDGNIYALIDLINEIGAAAVPDADKDEQQRIGRDVTRFFYLMRSHDTTMDFDLDLAAKMSDENPVFYVQYAHARLASVLAKARTELGDPGEQSYSHLLVEPVELNLVKRIADLPNEIFRSAEDHQVHRIATFAVELARTYHSFYDRCRVVQADQKELSYARMQLCEATQTALRASFQLLGISAPERM